MKSVFVFGVVAQLNMEDIFYDRLRQSLEFTVGVAPDLRRIETVNGIRYLQTRTFWSHSLELPLDWTQEDVEKQADAVADLLRLVWSERRQRDIYVVLSFLGEMKEPIINISAFPSNKKEADQL